MGEIVFTWVVERAGQVMSRQSREKALRLVEQMRQAEQDLLTREIIAPLLPGGKVRTRIDSILGVVYEFMPDRPFVGWGCFRPLDMRRVTLEREALPWERQEYLEQFPALRALLLWPDEKRKRAGIWWALSYNASDATTRFALPDEPFPVYLCDPSDGADRFERVIVRVDGRAYWYGGPDLRANPEHAERLREAREETSLAGLSSSERRVLVLDQLHQVDLARARAEQAGKRLEDSLRHALTKANAQLLSYREMPGVSGQPGYLVVEWSDGQETHRYRSTIARDMTIISSGICLSGEDRKFDLTSLVSVMVDRPGWQREEQDDDDY